MINVGDVRPAGLVQAAEAAAEAVSLAAHADRDLIQLGHRFADLTCKLSACSTRLSALRALAQQAAPKYPEALQPQEGDHTIGLHPRLDLDDRKPKAYAPDQVQGLRGRKFVTQQARANEILAAFDEWRLATTKYNESIGLEAAEQDVDRLMSEVRATSDAIYNAPVQSLRGLGIVAAATLWECETEKNPERLRKIAARLAQYIGGLTPVPVFDLSGIDAKQHASNSPRCEGPAGPSRDA